MQSYRRPIRILKVRKRHLTPEVAVASAGDFVTDLVRLQEELDSFDELLPYCIDLAEERLVLTASQSPHEWLKAIFLYQAQRERAEYLVTVPFERLHDSMPDEIPPTTFLFSIGRCGSTLLSSLLRAAGLSAVSEPDLFTQLAVMPPEHRRMIGFCADRSLIRFGTALLGHHTPPHTFVKLRSQCNGVARDIASAIPEAKFVCILRDPIGFAISRYRAFGDDPAALAGMICWGVETFDALMEAGHTPTLIWYDEIKDASALQKLGVSHDHVTACAQKIRDVLGRDSQEGTSLARGNSTRSLTGEQLREFECAWRRLAPRALIEKHCLHRLIDSLD